MISISHAQAKRLINAQLDERKLPDEQWSALHAHLESCAECRAYRARIVQAERRLRRGLRQRWEPVDGPLEATAKPLAILYHERWAIRRLGRKMLGGAAAFLLCALLIVGFSAMFPRDTQAVAVITETTIPPTPLPSPTPTRIPSDYKGVIAYEYRQPSEERVGPGAEVVAATPNPGEIYLLNTGAEPSNLTNNPADDYNPAWSPDGEWLAFLSKRTGKDEVYVMHLSGSRLTRLTDLAGVTWHGPISWSADGQMLALTGERTVGAVLSSWVYLVPLDGSNAYPLGHSAGAKRAAFSPQLPLLAFSGADAWGRRLAVYNFDPAHEGFISLSQMGSEMRVDGTTITETVDLFEWSLDGRRLLFRSNRDYQTSFAKDKVSAVSLVSAAFIERNNSFNTIYPAVNTSSPNPFTVFSWTGIKNEFAYLDGPVEDGCKTIRLGLTNNRKFQQPETYGFCVDGSLRQENWRVTDKSVLVTGWEPGRPGERGLYVVRFRGNLARAEWLGNVSGITGPALLRPQGDRLSIDPRPAALADSSPTPEVPHIVALPGPETGDLLMVSRMNNRTLIERVDPTREKHTLINQSVGDNNCPVWSPDRKRIAFLSERRGMSVYGLELFVMDSSGLNARPVVDVPYYSCPLWSPDGRWLAVRTGYGVNVVSADNREDQQMIYPTVGGGIQFLTWLPDGRLLVVDNSGKELVLRAYDPLSTGKTMPITNSELYRTTEWNNFSSASIAPGGKSILMIAYKMDPQLNHTFWLVTASLESSTPGAKADRLTIKERKQIPEGGIYFNTIGWLPDGRAGFLLNYPDGRSDKAILYAWAGEGSEPQPVAAFPDALQIAAWSPDNRWLTAITETGRYVLDLTAQQPEPFWVGPETGSDLDW